MSITVDHEPLAAESLGLHTIGQVLAHVQKGRRLVVQLLIDGQEPDLRQMDEVRGLPVVDHVLYIETADPRALALDVLCEVESHLAETDPIRAEAAALLQQGQAAAALQKLSGCFTTWQHAQESILKTAQLLRIDLAKIQVNDRPLEEMLEAFSEKLRTIRGALEQRDFVLLSDVLQYETADTAADWQSAIDCMRQAIQSLH